MFPGFLGFSVGNFIFSLLALLLLGENKCLSFQALSGDSSNRAGMEKGREQSTSSAARGSASVTEGLGVWMKLLFLPTAAVFRSAHPLLAASPSAMCSSKQHGRGQREATLHGRIQPLHDVCISVMYLHHDASEELCSAVDPPLPDAAAAAGAPWLDPHAVAHRRASAKREQPE